MPPPDSVAIASPLPNNYFSGLVGHPLAGLPAAFQYAGRHPMMPSPVAHPDYRLPAIKTNFGTIGSELPINIPENITGPISFWRDLYSRLRSGPTVTIPELDPRFIIGQLVNRARQSPPQSLY